AFRLVVEANSDLRAFAISGKPAFGDEYRHGRDQVRPALDALHDTVSDSPSQQERLRTVMGKADGVLAWTDDVHRLVRDGRRDEAMERINTLEGKHRIDALRTALDDFLGEEQRLDAERQATLTQTMHEQNWALVGGGVLAVASAGVLLWVFSRGIG